MIKKLTRFLSFLLCYTSKMRFLSFLLCYRSNHMVCHETKKYSSILKENSVSKQNLVKSQRYFVNPNTDSECESL